MIVSARFVLCAALVPLAPSIARAQFVYTLDASGTVASYADAPRSSGFSLAPAIHLDRERSSFQALGNLSLFDDGKWTAQGLVSGSLFTAPLHHFRLEGALTANGITYGGGRSAYLLGQGRLHFAGPSAGAWVGGGAGSTGSHSAVNALWVAETGGWWRTHTLTLSLSYTQSRFRSHDVPVDMVTPPPGTPPIAGSVGTDIGSAAPTGSDAFVGRDRILNDAVLAARWERPWLDLDVSAGTRVRSRTDPAQTWAAASGAFWVTRRAAIVVSAGNYPDGLIQGFPSFHYVTIGARLSASHGARTAAGHALRTTTAAPATALGFVLTTDSSDRGTGGDTMRTIHVRAPGARRIEIMADFTDWKPLSLIAGASGDWTRVLPIAPGTYLVSVRVDGGDWHAPPGVPPRHDEFGTEAGAVVVD